MSTARALLVCGTSSDAGKSMLVAGLCRAFARRGLRVAPFKGQNMALNAAVTADGAEIGRAQAFQAHAAGIEPTASMNPVLLKPTGERTSEVIVNGTPWRTLDAAAYQAAKFELVPVVDGAFAELREHFDLVLCEGAGSPAEINLLAADLVNLGFAQRAGIGAIIVGDIDRGGVFAHLFGTVMLIPEELRAQVRGFVINKFRGDPSLLGDAPRELEARTGVSVLGVVPWLGPLLVDAEDSLALSARSELAPSVTIGDPLDIAVVRSPALSNFTDFDALALEANVGLRFVAHPSALGDPDLVVLAGSKRTVRDLDWLRSSGMASAILGRRSKNQVSLLGICGGYQMLGTEILDPLGVESAAARTEGLGCLDMVTTFGGTKRVTWRSGRVRGGSGTSVRGYEIRYGNPFPGDHAQPWFDLDDEPEGICEPEPAVFGTSLHGIFESDEFRRHFLSMVAARRKKRWHPGTMTFGEHRTRQIETLADACEEALDLERLWEMSETSS
jgi:adenosylcobyric acid synthase